MRIAWVSAPPWIATGYGTQTNEVVSRLAADGHEVAVIASGGLGGGEIVHNGVTVIGSGQDARFSDILPILAKEWVGDSGVCITLMDVWAYNNSGWDELKVFSWVPIEHRGISIDVKKWFDVGVKKNAIAMSRFGESELLSSGMSSDRITYIPHSIDTKVFTPLGRGARAELGIPEDAHVTMINAANMGANPSRKSWPEMLMAWSEFSKKNKDAFLYLHTNLSPSMRGVNIVSIIDNLGIPRNRVRVAPQAEYRKGMSQAKLAELYSMADVLLMTSRGEGFGIPAVEAQACGVPVIVTDFSAQPELVGAGWKVGGQEEWDESYGGWFMAPNVNSITSSLEESYEVSRSQTQSPMSKARDFSIKYDSDHVFDLHWRPFIKTITRP